MAVGLYVKECAHYASVAIVLQLLSVLFPDTAFYYFTCTANLILYVVLATVTYNFCKHFYNDERVEVEKKAVLITGCDSGFGNSLAKKLDSAGFQVFASCLFPKEEGARQLKQSCSDRLHIFYMDVTKEETVKKALQFVENNLGSNVFWTVVNNAGIMKGFSIDFSSIDDFKDTIDVNALGPVRVTKAFLPLLKKFKGRVVNVTSLGGRISVPYSCAYTMSKRAVIAFTEILSIEMSPWGVRVISIEPEAFRTRIIDPELIINRMELEAKKISTDILSSYGEEYLKEMKKVMTKLDILACSDIDVVVDTIVTAITQRYPDHVYKPRGNIISQTYCFIAEILPFKLYEQILLFAMKVIFGYPLPKDVINSQRQNF